MKGVVGRNVVEAQARVVLLLLVLLSLTLMFLEVFRYSCVALTWNRSLARKTISVLQVFKGRILLSII